MVRGGAGLVTIVALFNVTVVVDTYVRLTDAKLIVVGRPVAHKDVLQLTDVSHCDVRMALDNELVEEPPPMHARPSYSCRSTQPSVRTS